MFFVVIYLKISKMMCVCVNKIGVTWLILLFGLLQLTDCSGYVGNSHNDEHYFRHQQHYNQRIEQAVNDFKESQAHRNISHINLRHHHDSLGELLVDRAIDTTTTASPFTLSQSRHHLRHYNRHHQTWEQRVFPSLHSETTTLAPQTRVPSSKSFSSSHDRFNVTTAMMSRYFDRDGLHTMTKPKNSFAISTHGPKQRDSSHHGRSVGGGGAGTSRLKNRRMVGIDREKAYEPETRFSYEESDSFEERPVNNYRHGQFDKNIKKKLAKKTILKSKDVLKNFDEYYDDDDDDEDDDDDDEVDDNNNNKNGNDDDNNNNDDDDGIDNDEHSNEEDETRNDDDDILDDEESDENSGGNNSNDREIFNSNSNRINDRILPKRRTTNFETEDIFSNSYIPGEFTRHKFETLGTHEAVKQSRKDHMKRRQDLAMAEAHRSKVHNEAKCRWPKPKVEKIQKDPSKIYLPHCTILHRCGDDTGCCESDMKTCVVKHYQRVDLYFNVKAMDAKRGTIEKHTFVNHTECHCVDRGHHRSSETPPEMMRRATILDCTCPKPYETVLQDNGICRCDCSSGNKGCAWLKSGMEHFSMTERKCIKEGRCRHPTCEYGNYIQRHGRCPKKEDKINFSRTYH